MALREAGIDQPRRAARILVAHALGITQEALLGHPDAPADAGAVAWLVARRAAREPTAHILGRREFWSLDFAVSPATLIPRPESETLIEAALAWRPERASVLRILDLGTGTGCLLLAALTEFSGAFGIGVDRNPQAVRLAAENARALGLSDRVAYACGDWAGALAARFDLVLCNPPYIAESDIPALDPEIRFYEPHLALAGGKDGFDAYRTIIAGLPRLLAGQGFAVLELGRGQAEAVAAIAQRAGFCIATRADLAGNPRAAVLFFAQNGKKLFGRAGKGD